MAAKSFQIVGIFLLSILLSANIPLSQSFSVSTKTRWIVDDESGERVKLACINWPSHVGPMLAEGLDKKPLNYIVNKITSQMYNCVRFTWATYMWTRPEYANLTVEASFDALNLTNAKAGLVQQNPAMLNMTIQEAFEVVVDVMGANNLLVILDNHISQPIWCCSDNDGNGFFGDANFDPEEWVRGLTTVARRFKGNFQVIGIGMRNELRGPHQNVNDWFKYIKYGATKINEVNPDVLTVASGLSYATDLSFLKDQPLDFNNNNKLVLEVHQYAWSRGPADQWHQQPVNQICGNRLQSFENANGFVLSDQNQFPIFFGEIGINERDTTRDTYFMDCFMSYMVDKDMDWGLWVLVGSYYLRNNQQDLAEDFGMMDFDWNDIKNPEFQNKLSILKYKLQEPSNTDPSSYFIFYVQSGDCIHSDNKTNIDKMSCKEKNWSHWIHAGDESPLKLMGTELCLKAVGDGQQPILSTDCSSSQSFWTSISNSKLHLAAKDENGDYLCLDAPAQSQDIVTNKCICVGDDSNCLDDPTGQWFKLVSTNIY